MAKRLPATWLAGTKVRLRAFETDDVPLLRRFGSPLGARATALVVQTTRGRDIGLVAIGAGELHTWIGLALGARRAWADGSASEALRLACNGVLRGRPVKRFQALVDPDDATARRAFVRAGFRYEGVLREVVRAGRRWRDGAMFARVTRA